MCRRLCGDDVARRRKETVLVSMLPLSTTCLGNAETDGTDYISLAVQFQFQYIPMQFCARCWCSNIPYSSVVPILFPFDFVIYFQNFKFKRTLGRLLLLSVNLRNYGTRTDRTVIITVVINTQHPTVRNFSIISIVNSN